jgi:transposase
MPSTPPLQFSHLHGHEIPTKHKEAIRQLYAFAKVPIIQLEARYNPGNSTIRRILAYDKPERARDGRKGTPQKLSDAKLDKIIEYLSEKWTNRALNYEHLVKELKLTVKPGTLQRRLHQRGYYRCNTCQKPYLTPAQAIARMLWAMAHIFWHAEWLKVLWSDEVTFLVGGRTCKEKVTTVGREGKASTPLASSISFTEGIQYRLMLGEQLDMATRVLLCL